MWEAPSYGGLAPTAMGNRVRLSKGKDTVIDGPFAETKEVIGSFAIFEGESKQEMIDAAAVSPIILQAIGIVFEIDFG